MPMPGEREAAAAMVPTLVLAASIAASKKKQFRDLLPM